ncbi:MAG: L,D-transpeptidase family protein [Verrucomicrobiales bacterium]|nr:L,D-transpeptidase family protein [Verrucomicrobiales bacterium]
MNAISKVCFFHQHLMIRRYLCYSLSSVFLISASIVSTSCTTVEQKAGFLTGAAKSGEKEKKVKAEIKTDPEKLSWSEKMKVDQEAKAAEKAKLAAAKEKETAIEARKLAAEKKVADAAKVKAEKAEAIRLASEKRLEDAANLKAEKAEAIRLAAEKKAEEAEKAAKIAKVEAEKKARDLAAAEKLKQREAERLAKSEAKKKTEANRLNRGAATEVSALSEQRGGGGFFSRLSIRSNSSQYKSEGHDIFVDQGLLATLAPSNAKIEISLSEQRARIYRKDGANKLLVIDTQISSGKPGHATGTGTYTIKEKLVAKRSTLYGTWVNSSGQTVASSGSSSSRPSGGARFVGAEMPYWMRINGGIGMHIGYVPDYPASHGCIRVPEAVQPLIYSKVGVGTSVTISH